MSATGLNTHFLVSVCLNPRTFDSPTGIEIIKPHITTNRFQKDYKTAQERQDSERVP